MNQGRWFSHICSKNTTRWNAGYFVAKEVMRMNPDRKDGKYPFSMPNFGAPAILRVGREPAKTVLIMPDDMDEKKAPAGYDEYVRLRGAISKKDDDEESFGC